MAVFIGRTIQPQSEKLLRKHGLEFKAQPLIATDYCLPDARFFQARKNKPDAWIISSKNAALWLSQYYQQIGFAKTDTIFCLSENQEKLLKKLGAKILVSEKKNSKSLEDLVKKEYRENCLVFLKGDRAEGFRYIRPLEIVVYRTTLLKPKIDKTYQLYLFFSPSGIESFSIAGNRLESQAQIIAIGETTAQKARSVFSNRVKTCFNQTEQEMVKKAICEAQKNNWIYENRTKQTVI
ncbi:uroporphyrinogen-III synthase [uncultured Draconibacterium sp.]|uniref:uroporphyrinogen-III synthase n=1 Tax=uncultured Draconibacterium sp. TaxID=1573823 RepID=UPI0032607776